MKERLDDETRAAMVAYRMERMQSVESTTKCNFTKRSAKMEVQLGSIVKKS